MHAEIISTGGACYGAQSLDLPAKEQITVALASHEPPEEGGVAPRILRVLRRLNAPPKDILSALFSPIQYKIPQLYESDCD